MHILHKIAVLSSVLFGSALFAMPYGLGCATDIDSDGDVGVGDVLAVIDAWGSTNENADCNGDGIVNVGDILMLIAE
ncbi:MAG: hypothetical protein H8E91_03050 [Planctomycetes bacterium]|nr:hypothetical protein [Planctomycetota bacterium]